MDPLWVIIAFALGLVARQIRLPPLVGFLAAGFILNALDVKGGVVLARIADLGVLLLLFSIGLKLRLRSLLRPEVWAGASIHMGLTTAGLSFGLIALSAAGVPLLAQLDPSRALLVAFALSFSSTVFAVKVFEERGELASLHARVAIGILVMQDVVAVVFITASSEKIPSPWALALVALVAVRPLLRFIVDRCGHGELLVLFGLALTFGAALLFELVGVKPDLGALVAGLLVAGSPKARELADALLGLKDLLLVGFFLTIGLHGFPDLGSAGVAGALVLALPLKTALFFVVLSRFGLRVRTSLFATLSLSNYSEFGLIVAAVGHRQGWIGSEWLVVLSLALASTLVLAAPLNAASSAILGRVGRSLERFQRARLQPEERPIDLEGASIAVLGMGRIGTGAYDRLCRERGDVLVGLEFDPDRVKAHKDAGRRVILADAADPATLDRICADCVEMALLAMPEHDANLRTARMLLSSGFGGHLAAVVQFDEDIPAFTELGIASVFNYYAEAGAGFAEHLMDHLQRDSM